MPVVIMKPQNQRNTYNNAHEPKNESECQCNTIIWRASRVWRVGGDGQAEPVSQAGLKYHTHIGADQTKKEDNQRNSPVDCHLYSAVGTVSLVRLPAVAQALSSKFTCTRVHSFISGFFKMNEWPYQVTAFRPLAALLYHCRLHDFV